MSFRSLSLPRFVRSSLVGSAVALAFATAACGLVACGEDDADDGSGPSGEAGSRSKGGAGGQAGVGGKAGGAGKTGAGAGGAAAGGAAAGSSGSTSGNGGSSGASGTAGQSTGGAAGASAGSAGAAGTTAGGGKAGSAGASNGGSAGNTSGGAGGGAGGSGGASNGGGAGSNAGNGGAGGEDGVIRYHVSCLLNVAGADPSKALRFVGVRNASSASSVSVTLTPLVVGATKLSQTTGNGVDGIGNVASPTTAVLNFGNDFIIPANANPVNAQEVELDNVTMPVVLVSPTFACGELQGSITRPIQNSLASAGDRCLFDQVAGGPDASVAAVSQLSRFTASCP